MAILKIYNSYYKHIPLGVFNAAVSADPTSYNQDKVVKVGNFVKWILKLYQNNVWKSGDSYETKDLLSKFIKYKSKLPIEKRDINKFNSISELYSLIQTLENEGVKTQSDIKREGAEIVYEDDEWKIVIPLTEEASCIYGAHTKWCTAGRGNNMFEYYNNQGPLYININKVTGEKYQFHFKSCSYMDAEDKTISVKKIGLSEGAVNYYKSIGKEPYFIYDKVGEFHNGLAAVELECKCNFINEQGELLWKEDVWFDYVYNFSNGFARVYIEGQGWNFINTKCELLWSEYKNYDCLGDFHKGFARIKIEDKGWNFINANGELLWNEYKNCDEVDILFHEGFAEVKLEGKYNYINTQGELLWGEYKNYDYVGGFSNGFGWVCKKGKGCNYINTQGELLWKEDEWFDYLWEFHNGIAKVGIKDKGYNYINTQGELLWKEDKWFDDVGTFYEGFVWVQKKEQGSNFINTQGELLWKGDKWFDEVRRFSNGFARVKLEGGWYKLNTKGELIKN